MTKIGPETPGPHTPRTGPSPHLHDVAIISDDIF